VLQV
jgi:hypothetical protein